MRWEVCCFTHFCRILNFSFLFPFLIYCHIFKGLSRFLMYFIFLQKQCFSEVVISGTTHFWSHCLWTPKSHQCSVFVPHHDLVCASSKSSVPFSSLSWSLLNFSLVCICKLEVIGNRNSNGTSHLKVVAFIFHRSVMLQTWVLWF